MIATERRVPSRASILERVLTPDKPLSAAAAKAILALGFPDADKNRLKELAGKARAGTLSAEEQEEVEVYGSVGNLISILKIQVRKAMAKRKPKTR